MPQHVITPNLLQRLTAVEQHLARLERSTTGTADEVPFYPTAYETMAYVDNTTYTTAWETTITPRGSTLSMRMVILGDSINSVNSGGDWQVLFNSAVVWSGSVPATFTYQYVQTILDVTPYASASSLHIELQARRTAGATTGGRNGSGGSIGMSPIYARLQ